MWLPCASGWLAGLTKLAAPPKDEAAAYAREHKQRSRDALRANDGVTQADLAADIATYDRLRKANRDAQRIRGPKGTFKIERVEKLQEYAVANPILGITRRIDPLSGLQGYRKQLLQAMQKHNLGA